MTRVLSLVPLVMAAACLSPNSYEAKFESKFCGEWAECNPDWECELGETDFSACEFDRKAAKACLDDAWVCDSSNTALPLLVLPDACSRAYINCGGTGTTVPTGGTSSDTGTTTTTSTY